MRKSYCVFTSQALTTLERLDYELAMLGCLLLKELTESRDREMGQRKRCGSLFKPAVCHFYYAVGLVLARKTVKGPLAGGLHLLHF